jgi:hypothetical protein
MIRIMNWKNTGLPVNTGRTSRVVTATKMRAIEPFLPPFAVSV